jgi:uncharacterized membrane protein
MASLAPIPLHAPSAPVSQRPGALQLVSWWAGLLLCFAMVAGASHYFFHRPTGHFGQHYALLLAHIMGGSGALLTGPWQFSRRLRLGNLALHRWLGRIYLCSVALGSVAAFALAIFSEEGWPTHFGFGLLAVIWFFTGWMAYRRALAGDVAAHREWMIRNFSLSLAAVTLRLYLIPLLVFAQWSFTHAYIFVAWMCWVPNILVAQWIIGRSAVAAIRLEKA